MMTDIEIVRAARSEKRKTARDYIDGCFTDLTEFSGDRLYGDDRAIIGGIGLLQDMPVTVI